MNQRKSWIDIYKGIAMLLVILHHTGLSYAGRFIAGFHMPLFFALSGYLYMLTDQYSKDINTYIKKYIRRLLIPFIVYIAIYWLIMYIVIPLFMGNANFNNVIAEIVHDVIYLEKYWFIASLFISGIVFHIFFRLKHWLDSNLDKISSIIGWLIALMIFSFIGVYVLNGVNYPLLLGQNLMAIVFLSIGALLTFVTKDLKEYSSIQMLVVSFIGGLAVVGGVMCNYFFHDGANFGMWLNEYGNLFFAMIGAVGGMFFIAGITYFVCKIKTATVVFEWFGINSLIIYPAHLWGRDIGSLIISVLAGGSSLGLRFFIKFICALMLSIIIVKITNGRLAFLAGKETNENTSYNANGRSWF